LVKLDGKASSVMPHDLEAVCGAPVLP
jgi:hypothetical protein